MAITKKPNTTTPNSQVQEDAFISSATDGSTKTKGMDKGNKKQISMTFPPELLARIDEVSKTRGVSRAGLVNLAVYHYLETVI